jgi:hypothetical protein
MPMSKPRQLLLQITRWEPLRGDWGAQLGVAELRLLRAPAGLHMRLPVFRGPAGKPVPGMPRIPGEAPGAAYSIYFDTDSDRARFLAAFGAELAKAAPELFEGEAQS